MNKTNGILTVFFDGHFWVGVVELSSNDKLYATKGTFGTEPIDSEVLEYVLKHYYELKFSPAVENKMKQAANKKFSHS